MNLRVSTSAMLIVAVLVTMLPGCGVSPFTSGLALQDLLVVSMKRPPTAPYDVNSVKYPPETFDHTLEANGPDWKLIVRWCDGELARTVEWQKGQHSGKLAIPLERRPRPWTWTDDEVTSTSYGPYQPAFTYNEMNGGSWHVTMSHERFDFQDEAGMKQFYAKYYSPPRLVAFDPSGLLVCLQVSRKGEMSQGNKILGNSLGISVFEITINGRPLTEFDFKSLKKGTITVTGKP